MNGVCVCEREIDRYIDRSTERERETETGRDRERQRRESELSVRFDDDYNDADINWIRF